MNAILLKGWGYWDITNYPYGGCFRRASEDLACEIVPGTGKYPDEVKVRFPNGHLGIVKRGALVASEPATLV